VQDAPVLDECHRDAGQASRAEVASTTPATAAGSGCAAAAAGETGEPRQNATTAATLAMKRLVIRFTRTPVQRGGGKRAGLSDRAAMPAVQ
jgi:hypothetical protein